MKRIMLVNATLPIGLLALGASLAAAQQPAKPSPYNTGSNPNAYTGTAAPPPDTTIKTPDAVQNSDSAPPAGVTGYEQPAPIPAPAPAAPIVAQPAPPIAASTIAQPSPTSSTYVNPADGTDDGIVQVAPNSPEQPMLNERASSGAGTMSDPDGDIVHPAALAPGEIGDGYTIRVRLIGHLSTATSQSGEPFRTRVVSDVMQNGQVMIPAGAELDGTIVGVSYGHAGGHGSMHLRPETVILPNGTSFHVYAQLSGAPGSSVRINGEGGVAPGSQLKKDSIEYGGAVGAGAITGAIVGGPGGALAGTLIGAGVISVHLLVSHPQATLDSGTVLLFTLNQPVNLVAAAQTGN
jgi:hypothetical protein